MKTQNSATENLSENFNVALKMFMETSNAMADLYSKQFEFGTNMMNKFLQAGSQNTERTQPIFNADLFHSSFEIFKRNMENMLDIYRKNIPLVMSFFGMPSEVQGENVTDTIMNAYNYQTRQMMDANKKFFQSFAETFKLNGEQENIFNSFQKNSERNFRMAEEGIRNALKTYSSMGHKSAKELQELTETVTRQLETLSQNNMKIWTDLLQTPEKETEMEEGRKQKERSKK